MWWPCDLRLYTSHLGILLWPFYFASFLLSLLVFFFFPSFVKITNGTGLLHYVTVSSSTLSSQTRTLNPKDLVWNRDENGRHYWTRSMNRRNTESKEWNFPTTLQIYPILTLSRVSLVDHLVVSYIRPILMTNSGNFFIKWCLSSSLQKDISCNRRVSKNKLFINNLWKIFYPGTDWRSLYRHLFCWFRDKYSSEERWRDIPTEESSLYECIRKLYSVQRHFLFLRRLDAKSQLHSNFISRQRIC